MRWAETGIEICGYIGVLLTVLYAYKAIYFAVGLFRYRKFNSTEKKYRYGICVAARNEEKVIGNFLESVAKQKYPLQQITVFICAHNCTDNTAKIAREFALNGLQVVVYEHNAQAEKTKGFALKRLFERIEQDCGIESFDGYFISDGCALCAVLYP